MSASWWDNPTKAGGDSPVVRHAPDDDQYHVPDSDMMGKMRGARPGRFAIIPAANPDGTSKAFDPTVAGPVHVDPNAPDGGVIFDPEAVRKSDVSRAVSSAKYPHQAYYQLGTPPQLLGREYTVQPPEAQPRTNNVLPPGAYLAPAAATDGRQAAPQPVAQPVPYQAPAPQPVKTAQEEPVSPTPMPQPAPVPQFPNQSYPPAMPYPYPPPDPNVQLLMRGMADLSAVVGGLVAAQRTPPPPATTGLSPNPLPVGPPPQLATLPVELRGRARHGADDYSDESARPIRRRAPRRDEGDEPPQAQPQQTQARDQDEPPQTLAAYRADQVQGEDVIVGFEALRIPCVKGPLAVKPKKQVVWHYPTAGTHMTRFHDVIVAKENIVLVYDTRYEDGQQYLPPVMDDAKFKITVGRPDAAAGGKKNQPQDYVVSSMGFTWSWGVFDVICLVRHHDEEVGYTDGGDDDE